MKNNKWGYWEGIVSVILNTVLFFAKYWAGVVSGSVALIADAWHTLSDSISSLFVIIGIKMASKKPDTKHPFGHGRYEQIFSIFIALFLAIIAFEFGKTAVYKLIHRESAHFGTLAIVVTIISIFVKEGLAQFALFTYRKTKNSTLKADAWHHRSDALSSVVVLIGIFFQNSYWWIDSIMGIFIAIMIAYTVLTILKEASSRLIGEKPDDQLIEQIKQIVTRIAEEEIFPHHFHLHDYGHHKELTFHVKLCGNHNIKQAHDLCNKIEDLLLLELNLHTTIHIEPLVNRQNC